jgi:hypothetical protein
VVRERVLAAGDQGLADVITLQVTKPMQLAVREAAECPERERAGWETQ